MSLYNTQANILQERYEYNNEGQQVFTVRIDQSNAEMIECEKENCGAWKNGECCYNA